MPSKSKRPPKVVRERQQQPPIVVTEEQQQTRALPIEEFRPPQGLIRSLVQAWSLLALAGTYSTISQLSLSPVYGSIPSSLYHEYLIGFTVLLAWVFKYRIRAPVRPHWINLLPVLASAIPTVQLYLLFPCSRQLGPVYGPLVTELFTYCPLLLLSVMSAARFSDYFNLRRYGWYTRHTWPGLGSYLLLELFRRVSSFLIGHVSGSFFIFSRSGLQLVIAATYAMLLPSNFLLLAIPLFLHTLCLNIHTPLPHLTEMLDNLLRNDQSFSLVDRQESVTGYISVLDNLKDGFRVLRCDHSLLGGVWDPQSLLSSSLLKEPIYSVFVILEAVRLVVSRSAGPRIDARFHQEHALVMLVAMLKPRVTKAYIDVIEVWGLERHPQR